MTFECVNDARLSFNRFCSQLEACELATLTVIATLSLVTMWRLVSSVCCTDQTVWKLAKSRGFRLLIKLPVIRGIAGKEIAKTVRLLLSQID